jgi:LPXTG-motif cell wall-anchored protein
LLLARAIGVLAFCGALVLPSASIAASKPPIVSEVRSVSPPVQGLRAEVVGGDYELSVTNRSGKTVVVKGYDGEQYLRFLPNGTVEVNNNSAAKYVNADRYGQTSIPSRITPQSPVRWSSVGGGGTYRWIDHRIHLTEKGTPPQVKDKSKRTKIFDWRVPLTVDGQPARVLGTLTWAPNSSSGTSTGLIVGLAAAAIVLLLAGFMFLRRRRRPAGAPPGAKREKAVKEAW